MKNKDKYNLKKVQGFDMNKDGVRYLIITDGEKHLSEIKLEYGDTYIGTFLNWLEENYKEQDVMDYKDRSKKDLNAYLNRRVDTGNEELKKKSDEVIKNKKNIDKMIKEIAPKRERRKNGE